MEDSNVSEDDDESRSETTESSSEDEAVQPKSMTNGNLLTINLQQNGRRESGYDCFELLQIITIPVVVVVVRRQYTTAALFIFGLQRHI